MTIAFLVADKAAGAQEARGFRVRDQSQAARAAAPRDHQKAARRSHVRAGATAGRPRRWLCRGRLARIVFSCGRERLQSAAAGGWQSTGRTRRAARAARRRYVRVRGVSAARASLRATCRASRTGGAARAARAARLAAPAHRSAGQLTLWLYYYAVSFFILFSFFISVSLVFYRSSNALSDHMDPAPKWTRPQRSCLAHLFQYTIEYLVALFLSIII